MDTDFLTQRPGNTIAISDRSDWHPKCGDVDMRKLNEMTFGQLDLDIREDDIFLLGENNQDSFSAELLVSDIDDVAFASLEQMVDMAYHTPNFFDDVITLADLKVDSSEEPESEYLGCCSCSMCSEGMEGSALVIDNKSGGITEAPGPAGSLQTLADYLETGFWDDASRPYRNYNIDDNGVFANSGVLYYDLDGYTHLSSNFNDADGLQASYRQIVRHAFDIYEEVLGINFVDRASVSGITNNEVDIFFQDEENNLGRAQSWGTAGNGSDGGIIDYSIINIGTTNNVTPQIGGIELWIALHEIGHALGLGHQGNYDFGGSYDSSAIWENDTWQQSMMSYWNQTFNTSLTASQAFTVAPMAVDWLALDAIYSGQGFGSTNFGVSQAFTGNTIYGVGTNITNSVSAVFAGLANTADSNAFAIVDGGGIDTIDFSNYNDDQLIDLRPAQASSTTGSISNVGGLIGNMTLAVGTIIERATTGGGDDVLYGNDVNNILRGNGGDDTILGFDGFDVIYGGSGSDLILGGEGGDTLFGNELVQGNIPFGSETNTISGQLGNDSIYGSDGVDNLFGGSDNDFIQGNAGSDDIDGGAGTDTASYYHATSAVTVNLAAGTSSGGDGNDTLTSIENLNGSNDFGDTLTGSNGANTVRGWGGNDTIDGANGADAIYGGSGEDVLEGGRGDDSIYGGDDNDTLRIWVNYIGGELYDGDGGVDTLDFSPFGATQAFNVDLNATTIELDSNGATSTVRDIENIIAGRGDDDLRGTNGNNRIEGNNGDDTIYGRAGNDTLLGQNGDDFIDGQSGNDIIFAGNGDDEVEGGADNDLITGEDGGDRLEGQSGDDILVGNDGNDELYGGTGNDTLYGNNLVINGGGSGEANALYGGDDSDELYGSDAIDFLFGDDGNDVLRGNAGDDRIDGGAGFDLVDYREANGAVTVVLATGNASGADGNDTLTDIENINGSDFDDLLTGDSFTNVIQGFDGQDNINGGAGNDVLFGGDDNDTINGSSGTDDVFGGNGNDAINAGSGADDVFGGNGDDLFFDTEFAGPSDSDDYFGGAGTDWVVNVQGFNSSVVFNLLTGQQTVFGDVRDTYNSIENLTSSGSATLIGTNGANILTMTDDFAGNSTITGNGGDDLLIAASGDDTLNGGSGADLIGGGDGDDLITGGTGVDTIDAGGGDDTVYFLSGQFWDNVDGGTGTDTIDASAITVNGVYDFEAGTISGYGGTLTLANVEIFIGGNASDDTIISDGSGEYYGGGGNDYMTAGLGSSETLDGGAGIDTLDTTPFSGDYEVNLVTGATNFAPESFINFENLISGAGDDLLIGTNGANTMVGGDGEDTIQSGAGDDTVLGQGDNDNINGGSGNDSLLGGLGDDVVNGDAGADVINGQGGDDTLNGGDGMDTIFGASGNDAIQGNGDDDTINGNGGDDTINGGDGNDDLRGAVGFDAISGFNGDDVISGGNQNDTLNGNAGNDTINGDAGNDIVNGGADNDTLIGAGGQDVLNGDAGDDNLSGDSGGDDLFGGTGNDRLDGGGGNDDLNGGAGADVFVANLGFRTDRIQDFENGIDLIDFSANSLASNIGQVLAAASQVGANVRIDLNANNALILENFDLADLDASDFIF